MSRRLAIILLAVLAALCALSSCALPYVEAPLEQRIVRLVDQDIHLGLPPHHPGYTRWVRARSDFSFRHPFFETYGNCDVLQLSCDFEGPVWVGAWGTARTCVVFQRVDPRSGQKLRSMDDLLTYIQWQQRRLEPPRPRAQVCELTTVNGFPAVRYFLDDMDNPQARDVEWSENLVFPVNEDLFVEIFLNVQEWERRGGSRERWLPQANALMARVRASIRLAPRADHDGVPGLVPLAPNSPKLE